MAVRMGPEERKKECIENILLTSRTWQVSSACDWLRTDRVRCANLPQNLFGVFSTHFAFIRLCVRVWVHCETTNEWCEMYKIESLTGTDSEHHPSTCSKIRDFSSASFSVPFIRFRSTWTFLLARHFFFLFFFSYLLNTFSIIYL